MAKKNSYTVNQKEDGKYYATVNGLEIKSGFTTGEAANDFACKEISLCPQPRPRKRKRKDTARVIRFDN